jgi:hypothetical protein
MAEPARLTILRMNNTHAYLELHRSCFWRAGQAYRGAGATPARLPASRGGARGRHHLNQRQSHLGNLFIEEDGVALRSSGVYSRNHKRRRKRAADTRAAPACPPRILGVPYRSTPVSIRSSSGPWTWPPTLHRRMPLAYGTSKATSTTPGIKWR